MPVFCVVLANVIGRRFLVMPAYSSGLLKLKTYMICTSLLELSDIFGIAETRR
jgi:hypothetical protein